MWRWDNVGGLGEHVKKHLLWFLRYTLLIFCFILRLTRSQQWTDFDNLYVIWRVSAQRYAFWGLVHTAPHFGGKIPQNPYFWGVNRHFQAYRAKYYDLHTIVCGLNTRKTNQRWRTDAILKIENLPYLQKVSTDLRQIWYDDACWASQPDRRLKFSTFKNPRWRTAAILKIENGQYLRNCSTDLREIWHNDTQWASKLDRLKFRTFKNPRWRTAATMKMEKSAISPDVWSIFTKFGTITHITCNE